MINKITDNSNKLNSTISGLLFLLAGSIILMGIITAESFYPEKYTYTTSNSMISDLGATEPPNSIITQPSASIFNFIMSISGILVILGAYFLFRTFNDPIATVLVGLLGLGALGVGIFPGNINPQHPLFALTTFISGGLSAIYAFSLIKSPFKYLSVLLGITGLFFLFTANTFIPIMGSGGVERWVAYPTILWLIGFGGYLMGLGSKKNDSAGK